ncbi:hypothetical protein VHEMI10159 [[Torrubiella] hemipterigena]|uniref:Nephrocystin 3-like N-terminal domain-containing protein n=1 Tax=[Torrubiella] hemipterigena TaxID=1531966 RepID=A0A0A1TRE2_9HYPO|nr:hypothetical protein VHEMI10159 [[Torrubiella] hemipterigena]
MSVPRGPVLDSTEAQLVQDLTQWLQPTDFRSPGGELMKHVRAYMPGTGDWVRKTPEYVHWVDADAGTRASPPNGCLWIKGVPGSGKSVVSGTVNHDPANLVRDYAAQLLPFSATLRTSLSQSKANRSRGFDQDAIWDATCTAMDELDRVYCIADALDEMDNESFDFINKLKALGNRQPSKIKVLLTSRPIPKLEAALQEQYIAPFRLEPTKIYPDITKYVKKSMASLVPRLSLETESRVTEALCEAAKGSFLHARLLMDNLEEGLKTDRQPTEDRRPDIIDFLVTAGADINHKASIDGVMMTPLDRAIALGSTNIALELIRYGAVPTNPDTVTNMDLSKHQERLDRLLRLHDDALIGETGKQHHSWYDLESEFTKVVSSGYHSAAVAFFDQVPTRPDLKAIEDSALRVLGSLIHQGQITVLRRLGKSIKEHPALEQKLPKETKLLNTICSVNRYQLESIQLLVDDFQAPINTVPHPLHNFVYYLSSGCAASARYLIEHGAVVDVMETQLGMTPLMRVLSHPTPHMELAEVLLAHGANPNAVSAKGSQSTLTVCTDPDALRLLFAHGADARLDVHAGALVALLTMGSTPAPKISEAMRLLIEAGQELNSAFNGRYPLLSAARKIGFWRPGDEEKAEQCCATAIECGADMSKQLADGRSIIQVVLEEHGLAKPFLGSPNLDMEARGLGGRTLLMSACRPFPSPGPRENSKSLKAVVPSIVDMLLDQGADTGAVDDVGRTALHWLCTIEAEADDALCNLAIRLIQSNPAAVLVKDKEGYTPLHLASKHQQPDIMDILMANGGDVFELDPGRNSALHWLAPRLVKPQVYVRYTYECIDESTDATKMIEYFKGLVAKGLDINQVNSEGRTPLFGFISADPEGELPKRRLYAEPFKIFRKQAANMSQQDTDGQNVLHILAGQRLRPYSKKVWLFKKLLMLGANPRQENNKLQTAIDIASTTSNYRVLELFRPELANSATVTDDSDISCSDDESSNAVPKKDDESSKVEEASDNESEPGYEVIDTEEVDTVIV